MSKRAVVHKNRETEAASEEEMAKRRRLADMLLEQVNKPVTEEGLQVWQELMDEIGRARRARSSYNSQGRPTPASELQEGSQVLAHKVKVTIPEDHRLKLAVDLPDDFPSGPAEVIVLAAASQVPEQADPESIQQQLAVLEEIRSTPLTREEEEILDGFETFRREHPFRLGSLDED